MFSVEKTENGFVMYYGNEEHSFKDEKRLIAGIRDVLGLPHQGRPFGSKNVPKIVSSGVDN